MTSSHMIQLLLTYPPLAARVGQNVFSKKVTQPVNTTTSQGPTPPYVTVKQIYGRHLKCFAGREGTAVPTFEIMAYDVDAVRANSLFTMIARYLDVNFSGTITTGQDPIKVLGIFQQDDEGEDWPPPAHVDEAGIHTAGGTFTVWHTEQK